MRPHTQESLFGSSSSRALLWLSLTQESLMPCQLLSLVPTQETHLETGNHVRDGRMGTTSPEGLPGLTPGLQEDLETGSSQAAVTPVPPSKLRWPAASSPPRFLQELAAGSLPRALAGLVLWGCRRTRSPASHCSANFLTQQMIKGTEGASD